jgi:hypothetical protein
MLKHRHFGKLKHHRHTSYASLFFVLVVVGVLLLGTSWSAMAAVPAVNPQSGSVGLTGRVNGPAPTTAATILTPKNGSRTSSIPITVSGTCPAGTFVSISKNGVFGGAAACQDDGTYSLLVDLFAGNNTLVAQVSDALGQLGPDSASVSVFYDAPTLNAPGESAGNQLFLETSSTVMGGNPGQSLTRSVTVVGGIGPYAVSWDWGDDGTSLVSEASPGTTTASHSYARPGTYRVIVRVTDSVGNSAYMEVIDVINGPVDSFGATKGNGLGALPGQLLAAWPVYGLAVVMVGFFWLGERREVSKLRRKHLLA